MSARAPSSGTALAEYGHEYGAEIPPEPFLESVQARRHVMKPAVLAHTLSNKFQEHWCSGDIADVPSPESSGTFCAAAIWALDAREAEPARARKPTTPLDIHVISRGPSSNPGPFTISQHISTTPRTSTGISRALAARCSDKLYRISSFRTVVSAVTTYPNPWRPWQDCKGRERLDPGSIATDVVERCASYRT